MNKLKIIISYLLIILLFPIKVYATGSFDGFELNGTWGDGNQYQAYTYNNGNDDALPTGFKYYYKLSNGKVIYMERQEVVTNILTRKVGVVLSPSRLAQFVGEYGSGIVGLNPNYYNELKPVLKDGNIVGVALNGLTGGTLETGSSNQNVSIPSNEVNNVYNFYNYWSENEGAFSPDYIILNGTNKQALNGSFTGDYVQYAQQAVNAAGEPCFIHNFIKGGTATTGIYYNSNNSAFQCYYPKTNCILVCSTLNNFSASLGLDAANYTLTWDEYKTKSSAGQTIKCLDKTNYTNIGFNYSTYNLSTGNVSQSTNGGNPNLFACGSSYLTGFTGMVTIYKSADIVTQITNNTYSAPQYVTNNNRDFSTDNDNTYNTTTNQVQNSTQDNDTIYNETNTSNNTVITEQITNTNNTTTNIDQSQIITNTTTIVNTYYENNYGSGGSGGDNNPDNPSGGGGLEDDSVLDALLAAILKLLRAIGKIIATILTGIIDIITDVLTAITNITTSFTGIIEFIGSIFGFLPSECIAVLTLGLTISVLIALLKMFGK